MFDQLLSVFLKFPCEFCNRPVSFSRRSDCSKDMLRDRNTPDRLCEYCYNRLLSNRSPDVDRLKLFQAQSTFAWGRYDGQVKRAIALMKYDRQLKMGEILGTLLGEAWLKSKLVEQYPKTTVVPIPMYHQKQKSRGFNQAEIIASSFCRATGYRLNNRALIRVKDTAAMFNLASLSARAKNLEGAIELGVRLPKYPVLLIDDIYTTGTTIKEATKVFQAKKIKVIGVAVVAKAGLRN